MKLTRGATFQFRMGFFMKVMVVKASCSFPREASIVGLAAGHVVLAERQCSMAVPLPWPRVVVFLGNCLQGGIVSLVEVGGAQSSTSGLFTVESCEQLDPLLLPYSPL